MDIKEFPFYNKIYHLDKNKLKNILKNFKITISTKKPKNLDVEFNKLTYPLSKNDKKKLEKNIKEIKEYCFIELDYFKNLEINQLADYYTEPCRIECETNNQSPLNYFNENKNKFKNLSLIEMRKMIYKGVRTCSNFNIVFSINILKLFKPKIWIDISSGWGDRLMSAICYNLLGGKLKKYIGSDPNPCLQQYYNKMINDLTHVNDKSINYKVIQNGFIEADFNKYLGKDKCDLIFSSPPFFTVEKYSSSEEDSITKFNTIDEWKFGFLFKSIEKSYELLRKDGYLALYIEDRDDFKFIEDMKNYAKVVGFADTGSIYYYFPNEGFKYQSKPREIFVFKKN